MNNKGRNQFLKQCIEGWFTTRDTLWACLALGEMSAVAGTSSAGTLEVTLNGESVAQIQFDENNLHWTASRLRNIFLESLKKGTNVVQVTFQGVGKGNLVLEEKKWYSTKPRVVAPVNIIQTFETEAVGNKTTVSVAYQILVNSTTPLEGVMLEQVIFENVVVVVG